jgi:transposase
MTKTKRTIVRYSISFKQQVVREVEEEGVGIEQVRKRYGIKGTSTIQNWIRKFGREHLLNKVIRIESMEEKDRLKQLEQENKKLKMALADAYLAKDCLEVLVELANEHYKTDLKKSFGGKEQKGSTKDTA